ncbi:Anti-sigma regulatory factor (Ser/Thr protein kinase) [Lentzea jiangxiensis]|uniref:Anti-sigma regulatory factor (Ser/Thr protein kinase) n=1 Tax=Lentzea jiangxiensis TaxID=641025 RepID=A0A1H0J1K0_9PSEU|nr:Anti-sigma regulatory factor (Ser/Thr protein kinase) [Lentzea jiangxiensis]
MAVVDDPPDSSHVLELDSEVPDIAVVRQWARTSLPSLHEDDLLDVQLVVTELVSNVYDHGRFPARLRLHRTGAEDGVEVVVEDASATPPALQPSSPDSVRGRGLVLVDQLCERWGVTPQETGKAVWAVVPCTATP